MNDARATLREKTRTHHHRVDAAFSRFDLSERKGYSAFLLAHAAVLPVAERLISAAQPWSGWRPRSSALLADLRDLGEAPPPSAFEPSVADDAGLWGMLYVLEGSRLGGAMLAQRVPASLPRRYLSMRHEHGSWRAFADALEARSRISNEGWLERASVAAALMFEAFEAAALTSQGAPSPRPTPSCS